MCMKRTTILADPAVMTELEYLAREDGVPTSRLIREALERYVSGRMATGKRKLPSFVGIGHGGGEDVAGRAHEILRDELPRAVWADRDSPPPWGQGLRRRTR